MEFNIIDELAKLVHIINWSNPYVLIGFGASFLVIAIYAEAIATFVNKLMNPQSVIVDNCKDCLGEILATLKVITDHMTIIEGTFYNHMLDVLDFKSIRPTRDIIADEINGNKPKQEDLDYLSKLANDAASLRNSLNYKYNVNTNECSANGGCSSCGECH